MTTLRGAIRQAWWAPVAAFAIAYQLVILLDAVFDSGEDADSRIAAVVICAVGIVAMAAGLLVRQEQRARGNALLLIGCFFAVFWFWTLVLPLAGIVVAVGVLTGGWRAAEATTIES